MKVTTGNLEIFESGIARSGFVNNIKFDFSAIWIEFTFLTDGKEYRSEYVASEDLKGLRINIYNCNSTLGAGVSQPIKVGSLDDRELWLAYRCFKAFEQHEGWVVEYVFYKGDVVSE